MITKTRNTIKTIKLDKKWAVIEDFLNCKLSNSDIAEKHQLSTSTVNNIINDTYRKFQNVRETKALIATQKNSIFLRDTENLNPDRINKEFLNLLSEEESLVLTDSEMMFSELFVNNGNELSALEESGLSVGLNKANKTSYNDSLRLRSFFLRRKPNVAAYISKIQKDKLKIMENGKEHLQAELLSLVEKLRNNGDPRAVPSLLKTIELLGKSIGAFEERTVVEHVQGDSALDLILQKAKSANELIEL